MITKIDYIKDFGIFKNFNWSNCGDLVEFKEKNIIYGWNYSGKNTSKELFEKLKIEKEKIIQLNFPNSIQAL